MEQYATINLPDYHMCGILYAALAWASASVSEMRESLVPDRLRCVRFDKVVPIGKLNIFILLISYEWINVIVLISENWNEIQFKSKIRYNCHFRESAQKFE